MNGSETVGMNPAAGRVRRALELGVYDDPSDAMAHEGGNLTDEEWADVREWFGALVDYPRA